MFLSATLKTDKRENNSRLQLETLADITYLTTDGRTTSKASLAPVACYADADDDDAASSAAPSGSVLADSRLAAGVGAVSGAGGAFGAAKATSAPRSTRSKLSSNI